MGNRVGPKGHTRHRQGRRGLAEAQGETEGKRGLREAEGGLRRVDWMRSFWELWELWELWDLWDPWDL